MSTAKNHCLLQVQVSVFMSDRSTYSKRVMTMFEIFRAVVLIALTQLIAQAAIAAPQEPPEAQVKLIDGAKAVYYQGEMDDSAIVQVATLIKSAEGTVKRLVINSGGGDVNGGMDLAELVLAHQLDVEVERLCASSCANYVFPAGKTKQIQKGAVVVWHGSAIQMGLDDAPGIDDIVVEDGRQLSLSEKRELLEKNKEGWLRYITEARIRQADLYKRMGVDERVTVVGQQLKAAQEWTLTVEDMARFGIKNVIAPEHYGEVMPDAIRERGVKLLYLEDYPGYEFAPLKAP